MIIFVEQTSGNIKQEFSFYQNKEWIYSGTLGRWHAYHPIVIQKNSDILYTARFKRAHWSFYIPFKHLFGGLSLRRCANVDPNNATFTLSLHGPAQSFYVITDRDSTLRAYTRSIGAYSYVAIYLLSPDSQKEEQIALIETPLTARNNCYHHTLYLRDEQAQYRDLLCMFVLYYANFYFVSRGSVTIGSSVSREWTYSHYNNRVDPSWKAQNFPEQ